MDKEQKAKRYAESIPQFDERKRYCIEDFYAGWEAAMQYLYKLPLDLAIEEIINQNKDALKRLKDR